MMNKPDFRNASTQPVEHLRASAPEHLLHVQAASRNSGQKKANRSKILPRGSEEINNNNQTP